MSEININQEVKWQETKPVEVSATVAKVRVSNIQVVLVKDELVVMAPYAWLDADGKGLRSGTNRQTQADLLAKLGAQGFAAYNAAFRGLMCLTNKYPVVLIRFGKDVTAIVPRDGTSPQMYSQGALDVELQKYGLNVATLVQTIEALGRGIVLG